MSSIHKYAISTGEQRRIIYEKHCLYDFTTFSVHKEHYITNTLGNILFTQSWIPKADSPYNSNPRGVIFFCHGFSDHSSWFFGKYIARMYVEKGYHVYAYDDIGHGRSDGLHCYIAEWRQIVNDTIQVINCCKNNYVQLADLKYFIHSESMGGANALSVVLQQPDIVNGVILSAPMCRIADDVRPPPVVITTLKLLNHKWPAAKIVPVRNMDELVFRSPEKVIEAKEHPLKYRGKPRVATALQLLQWTDYVEGAMKDISIPMLIMHGEADKITDPQSSRFLYQRAATKDKTLNMYPGAYHALLVGEPAADAAKIWNDVIRWVEQRS